jgi:hypothetical protein
VWIDPGTEWIAQNGYADGAVEGQALERRGHPARIARIRRADDPERKPQVRHAPGHRTLAVGHLNRKRLSRLGDRGVGHTPTRRLDSGRAAHL